MQRNIALASLPPPENLAAVGHFARAGEVAMRRYHMLPKLRLKLGQDAVDAAVEMPEFNQNSGLVFGPAWIFIGASHEWGTPGEVWLHAVWQSH
jgi:hypothetical protein